MARGTAVSELVRRLRVETGRSSTAVSNTDEKEQLVELLRRTQVFYYNDYDWPSLQTIKTLTLEPGQRFYPVPSGLTFESMTDIAVRDGSDYEPLARGIGFEQWNLYDSLKQTAATGSFQITGGTLSAGVNKITSVTVNSVEVLGAAVDHTGDNSTTATAVAAQITAFTSSPDYTASAVGATVTITAKLKAGSTPNTFVVAVTPAGDVTVGSIVNMAGGVGADQTDPIERWDYRENPETGTDEIEVWPVPATANKVYAVGKKALTALAADADKAILDDDLLVLSAAAELLARGKKDDAAQKANLAQSIYLNLKARENEMQPPIGLRSKASDTRRVHGTIIRITG